MFRVRVAGSGWTGGPGLNTFYFTQDTDSYILSGAQLAHDRVHAAFVDSAGLYPNTHTRVVSPLVDVLDPVTGEITNTFTVTPSANVPGTGPDASMSAPATALMVRFLTSTFLSGRRLQGRAFLSPLYSQMTDGAGTPTATAIGHGQALGAALLDVGIEQVNLVVWRRPRVAKPEATPPVTARVGATGLVVAYSTPDKFAVLRSRRD